MNDRTTCIDTLMKGQPYFYSSMYFSPHMKDDYQNTRRSRMKQANRAPNGDAVALRVLTFGDKTPAQFGDNAEYMRYWPERVSWEGNAELTEWNG